MSRWCNAEAPAAPTSSSHRRTLRQGLPTVWLVNFSITVTFMFSTHHVDGTLFCNFLMGHFVLGRFGMRHLFGWSLFDGLFFPYLHGLCNRFLVVFSMTVRVEFLTASTPVARWWGQTLRRLCAQDPNSRTLRQIHNTVEGLCQGGPRWGSFVRKKSTGFYGWENQERYGSWIFEKQQRKTMVFHYKLVNTEEFFMGPYLNLYNTLHEL